MILQNTSILGTMFPIDVTRIVNESNKTWGLDKPSVVEGQMAFALLAYLGGMHLDLHAPGAIIEGEVQLLQRYGLPEIVKAQGKLYDMCVRRGFSDQTILMDALEILPSEPVWYNFVQAFLLWRQSSQLKAWTLRFLKRFTVDKAQYLMKECLTGFVITDNMNRLKDRYEHTYNISLYSKVTLLAREYLRWLLVDFNVDNVTKEVESYSFRPTPNAVANCCSDPRHRIARVLGYLGKLPTSSHMDLYPYGPGALDISDLGRINIGAVPKDVKSYRIVSPDDPINLAYQQAIVHELERCINARGMQNNLPFRDQSIMVRLAYDSVMGGADYATIDMSRASDTVRLSLVRDIFPNDVANLIGKYRPRVFHSPTFKNDEYRTLYMAAPMGCAFTLLLQSLVFWAIDCSACQLFAYYCRIDEQGKPTNFLSLLGNRAKKFPLSKSARLWSVELFPYSCYAMGDDQQVPTVMAEFVIQCLQEVGFTVNSDKSFFDEELFFRESCGAEAIKGDDPVVDGFYIPRHSLAISCNGSEVQSFTDLSLSCDEFWNDRDRTGEAHAANSVTAIISMAKVFLQLGLPHIGNEIQKWIAKCVPQMTASQFGTPADDLWFDQDIVRSYHRQPIAYVTDGEIVRRFIDPTLPPYDRQTIHTEYKRIWQMESSDEAIHAIPMHWAVSVTKKRLARVDLDSRVHDCTKCSVCRWLVDYSDQARIFLQEIEYYRYQVWLQVGPNYQDSLDELLRVSSPSPRLDVISSPKPGLKF